ncbi:type II secretion protein [Haloferax mediterranei ATCC 33500]|uniref:Type II secretion protein n=1 Tax=Haloferax mediterranei (strain ATCC 33500 / DSM 1411 / JCM 8866 / NBRC 14739 / NCIMB 2177 / R-4) TaxID=523841 RepID=I3R2G8_HALMT|nr:type II/IV secretion system ATPase subunit [Haloferax mediterranei]AFK18428.1 type II/IV secretion system proteins VirB11/TadA (ATPase) [Haloferax mediterranei ATCC 33500]EMA02295.1 type II/IV secretion system proteins VirB11/TadA (ATPase) [Haloferax mediterranei ATCC 33500]MDX5988521.1 type II/IV secretion system ATPase subunit [Haloferax mediterranei ATCC 33500]QCQ74937.1 type II secretion protein [Haloferax mediterranei ATCC 33500]
MPLDSLSETIASALPDTLGDRLADATGDYLLDSSSSDACECTTEFTTPTDRPHDETVTLAVDASACPNRGLLAHAPACRATVIEALETRDADGVVVRTDGLERRYDDAATGLLVAAGRFAERVHFHDERLAERARRDPLAAAYEANGRAGPIRRAAAETGLSEGITRTTDYDDALRAVVGPTLARSRVDPRPPADGRLVATTDLDTGAVARQYETPNGLVYHLDPPESKLDQQAARTLAAAHDALARGSVDAGSGVRAPGRAVRLVADAEAPVETLTTILAKHTQGHGVLDDLFSDPAVSDVYVSTPADENPIRVVVDGTSMPTNVRLAPGGAESLASRLRRVSGASFSRADPTLDTVVDAGGVSVRVAGVTAPASDGLGFAFRRHDETPLTLPALVANGTISADAAALCSLAVERGASVLVAGSRGAGKTTFLGSLLWELPSDVRTVLIEDTPELPASSLRSADRDVQTLRTDTTGGPEPTPQEALHAALRLGDGALALGEVRGEEAAVLYEAMRVGANANAVLGTIHGDGAADVRERVVSDLDVPASSFAATDLVITCERAETHRVARVEEVRPTGDDAAFETLFSHDGDSLVSSGAVSRGDSLAVESLSRPGESYADVLDALETRTAFLKSLAETGRTKPADLAAARAERDSEC